MVREERDEVLEQRLRKINRNYLIATIVWAIVAAIGFAMVIIGSSPPWFGPIGEMAGIIGAIGTWFSILDRANRRNQERMMRNQELMLRNQEHVIELLRDIKKFLTPRTRLRREELFANYKKRSRR